MGDWVPYGEVYPGDGHTVVGTVLVWPGVAANGLAPRDVLIYLPPSYGTDPERRYPVLYLQDGQNVFDAATSFAGEWGADESAEELAARGLEAILVAVPNSPARAAEYSPWPLRSFPSRRGGRRHTGQAQVYLDFLLGTVKPRVEADFPVTRERAYTGIAGSSLGALISLYACLSRPGVFGFCAALSPALWPGRGQIITLARRWPDPAMRLYLDVGRREAGERFVMQVQRLAHLLRHQGCTVAYVEDPAGEHNEQCWRRRFPAVLAWLIDPARRPDALPSALQGVPL